MVRPTIRPGSVGSAFGFIKASASTWRWAAVRSALGRPGLGDSSRHPLYELRSSIGRFLAVDVMSVLSTVRLWQFALPIEANRAFPVAASCGLTVNSSSSFGAFLGAGF